ncbi:MAG TPA: nucleotidyltransferase domain-containing protein [Treponema sp.]|nr:nucleotidyltransferase domain-containing protein [Treponema sp.]HRS04304.1 nucleotidyltransferase domain-containing protein [Treponema sp.]
MSFGLKLNEEMILKEILNAHLRTGKVIVYGSRAKGTNTARSDIDLVIKDSIDLNQNTIAEIKDSIDESDFPYLVDIQYYEQILNPDLVDHIDRVGKVFFEK